MELGLELWLTEELWRKTWYLSSGSEAQGALKPTAPPPPLLCFAGIPHLLQLRGRGSVSSAPGGWL